METIIPTTLLLTLTGCLVAAAWPLLFAARLRPTLAGIGGSGCIGLGATVVGLLAGGFVQLPGMAPHAFADDKEPAAAKSQVAEAPPAERKSATAEADPEIDVPRDTVEIPPGRPEWVGSEPSTKGKVHKIAVSSGPYATNNQSLKALDAAIVKATNEYIADQLESERAPQLLRAAWPSGYSARAIKERCITNEKEGTYHDVARYSVGWMHENFALLEFDTKFRNELNNRWTRVRATSRLAQTGLVSGAALLLLSSVFGYFRLDNATRGYYTGRLQFMTATAILAVVGAGAVLAQWIHWL